MLLKKQPATQWMCNRFVSFSLIELLGCLALLTMLLLVGIYSAKDTLATTFSTFIGISENEIYSATKMYINEKQVNWLLDEVEYVCITMNELVDYGYFDYDEVEEYMERKIN